MLTHVVLIALNEAATEAQVAAALDGLAALPQAIAEIRSLECGRDAGVSDSSVDLAFVVTFDSVEDFESYRTHPAHLALARDLIRPILGSATTSQFIGAR